LAGEPVDIVSERWSSKTLRLFKRRKKSVLSVLAVALVLLSTTAISLVSSVRANRYAEQAVAAELLAKERLTTGNKARQAAQLERSRSSTIESQAKSKQRELIEQQIALMAIARFNKGDDKLPAEVKRSTSPQNRFVSTWLLNRLGPRLARLLPTAKTQAEIHAEIHAETNAETNVETKAQTLTETARSQTPASRSPSANVDEQSNPDSNDLSLLELLLEEKRLHYGQSELELAPTLDLLGEKYLALGYFARAEALLRESLFIRTNFKPDSEDRVWTMILLPNALKRSGATREAQAYIESATKLVDRLPQDSRFRKLILQLDQ
jgi:tetratricopeptide (TPR) repeat protein